MTDKLYLITEAHREQLQNTLKQCWHTVSPETDPLIASSEAMLQSLPMVDSEPVNNAFLTTPELSALNRFLETCEDGEGYDVPKSMMQRLSQIGVVRHLSKGIYCLTEFGQSVIEPLFTSPQALKETEQAMKLAKFGAEVANYVDGLGAISSVAIWRIAKRVGVLTEDETEYAPNIGETIERLLK